MPPDPTTLTYDTTICSSSGPTTGMYGAATTGSYVIFSNMTNTAAGTCASVNTIQFYGSLNGFQMPCQTWGSAGPGHRREWEPVQAAALRKDFELLKTSWKRKRAEIKAKRFFHLVVGDVAFQKFQDKGYHEIIGFSRTRYRLRPGFRVQVMKEADEVDYELCAHLEIGIPWHDSMAVQHLMLTASQETEDKFKAAANRHDAHSSYPIQELTDAA